MLARKTLSSLLSMASIAALGAASNAQAATWNTGQVVQGTNAAPTLGANWSVHRRTGATCTGPEAALTIPYAVMGTSWRGFRGTGFNNTLPVVANGVSGVATYGTSAGMVTSPPTTVLMHPDNSDCAVVRFTAPTTGAYGFYGQFSGAYPGNGTQGHDGVTPYIIRSNAVVAPTTGSLGSTATGVQNFTYNATLNAGDTVDFAVSKNNAIWADSTIFRMNVDGPDPSQAFKANRLDAEGDSTCATEQGTNTVHCWGSNGSAKQLGLAVAAPFKSVATPSDRVIGYLAANPSFGPVTGLQRSLLTTCAKTSNNQTFCWGNNTHKVAGLATGGTTLGANPPYGVSNVTAQLGNYQKPRLDSHNGCLVVQGGVDAGKVRCWGINDEGGAHWYRGNLGHQTSGTPWSASDTLQPPVPNVTGASGVTSGYYACAIANGAQKNVICWGHAGQNWGPGVMGGGTATPTFLPGGIPQVTVKTSPTNIFTGAEKVLASGPAACALKAGALYCWGLNATYGTLLGAPGPGFNFATQMPGPFASGVTDFAIGTQGICAIRGAGAQVFCQGVNKFGQMGRGNTDGKSYTFNSALAGGNVIFDTSPVAGVAGATSISAGKYFFCVTTSTGDAKCWGANQIGQLGRGTSGSTAHSGTAMPVIK